MGEDGPKMGRAVFAELNKTVGQSKRRSALDRWMWANFEEFSWFLEEHGTDWAKMTEAFEACGFGEDGKPLGPESARLTWYRVRRRKERQVKRPGYIPPTVSEVSARGLSKAPTLKPSEPEMGVTGMSSEDALANVIAEMKKRSGR